MGRIADFWRRVDALDQRIAGRGRQTEERDGWYALPGGSYGYGYTVGGGVPGGDVERALCNAASWACIDVLTDGVGRTPFNAIRGRTPSDRAPVDPVPQILDNPSGLVGPDVWKTQLAWSMLTDGNVFGRIVATQRGWPVQIELLDPTAVTERKVVDGRKVVKVDQKPATCWPFGDIWHVPGRMVPAGSPFGLSPLKYANKVIGTSLQAEDFSYQFFAGGGHPSMAIRANKEINEPQADQIKASYRRATSNGNREPLIIGSALELQNIQLDPNETQFIDLMRFNVEQACRFWRVPPSMVYASVSGQNVTYANVSDADLMTLKWSLDGYLVRLEEAYTAILPRPQYAKADRNAVLRTDAKSRFDVYQVGIRNGLYNRNEIRAWEDLPPIADSGDEYVWPPVGQGAGMDQRPPSTGGVSQPAEADNPGVNAPPAPAAPAAPKT